MNLLKVLFISLLALFVACSGQNDASSVSNDIEFPFYDLKSFFQSEINRLNKQQPSVEKKVAIQENIEQKTLEQLDYEQELQAFVDADINRVAWFDQYQIDTTFSQSQIQGLSYTALSEKLKTRTIQINFSKDGTIQQVQIYIGRKSSVAGSIKQLTYEPQKGYTIATTQSLIGTSDKEITLEVTFLN